MTVSPASPARRLASNHCSRAKQWRWRALLRWRRQPGLPSPAPLPCRSQRRFKRQLENKQQLEKLLQAARQCLHVPIEQQCGGAPAAMPALAALPLALFTFRPPLGERPWSSTCSAGGPAMRRLAAAAWQGRLSQRWPAEGGRARRAALPACTCIRCARTRSPPLSHPPGPGACPRPP